MYFLINLRNYFGTVLLPKFQGDLVNAETLSGQKGHLMISLRALHALWLQPMLIWAEPQLVRLCTIPLKIFPIPCRYVQMLLYTYLAEVPGLQHKQYWIWNNSWYNCNSKWMLFKMNNTAQCYLNSNGSHRDSSFGTILLARKLELLPIPTYLQYT